MTYRIKDWDTHFENHESRKIKAARWVGLPNKHDGKSYRRIAGHRDGIPVFAAWTLILEVASKMPVRGVLADEDGALDASDLSAMTGFPSEIFDKAFKLLTEHKIGWLEEVGVPETSRVLPKLPDETGKTAVEQKGRELNGTEQNIVPAAIADAEDSVKDFKVVLDTETPQRGLRAKKKTRDPRIDHPAIRMLKGIMARYPDKILWDELIEVVGESPDAKKLNDCRKEWLRRGYNPNSTDWTQWYRDGIPERNVNGHGKARQANAANSGGTGASDFQFKSKSRI